MAEVLRRAIQIYEPRLAEVHVTVEPAKDDDFILLAFIEAVLVADRVPEPFAFTTAVPT